LSLAIALVGLALGGCRGKDISFDCENQRQRLNDRAEEEEKALIDVPTKGPYPVALQISTDGINRLLVSVIDEDVPFTGSVPFGLLPSGPADAKFSPTSVPVIRFDETPGCSRCVVFHLDFNVQLDSEGKTISSGAGFVDLYVPLRMDSDAATGTSKLVASYGDAKIGAWYLSVFGFDSDTHEVLSGALKVMMRREIAETYGDIELLSLDSWQIGQGDVRLLARELFIHQDDPATSAEGEDEGKIVLAMHTNLPLGDNIGLDLDKPLLPFTTMVVSMDPDLLLVMAHRMMAEGEIARFYNEDGEPDPDGIYGVSLEGLAATESGDKALKATFKVWRIDDGYCGYATVEMPLSVGVDASFQRITVKAGEAIPIGGEGSGAAAVEEQELVEENQHLIDQFRADLAEQLANTMNYEALVLEGSDIVFVNQDVVVSPAELTSFLDFIVLAQE
jgi:hypothetical protein